MVNRFLFSKINNYLAVPRGQRNLIFNVWDDIMKSLCMYVQLLQSCSALCNPMDCSPPGSSVRGDFPGKNTGVGCHSLLQGIFPIQGSNQCFLHLALQADSFPWSHQGSPVKSSGFVKVSVQLLSHVWLFATPWIAARQASLPITNSRSSPKLMSIESVMPSSHLILCHPLLLLPPIPPSIRVFSNESTLRMRCKGLGMFIPYIMAYAQNIWLETLALLLSNSGILGKLFPPF